MGEESPLRELAGKKIPSVVRLLQMVRYKTNQDEWYFFHAQKQHREKYVVPGGQVYGDPAPVGVTGWVRLSPTGVFAHVTHSAFQDESYKLGRHYSLLGILMLDDRKVWMTEGGGWEWNFYELFEIGPGDTPPHSVLNVGVGD